MATTTMTLAAERWLDEVYLTASVADVGAASLIESFLAPSGLDDLAIMNVMVSFVSIATVPVSATLDRGARLAINSQDNNTQIDHVGVAQFFAHQGDGAAFTGAAAYFDPDALCLWRRGELLVLNAVEMDAGATGDLRVAVKAVRVRQIEAPSGQGPIQLVRPYS